MRKYDQLSLEEKEKAQLIVLESIYNDIEAGYLDAELDSDIIDLIESHADKMEELETPWFMKDSIRSDEKIISALKVIADRDAQKMFWAEPTEIVGWLA